MRFDEKREQILLAEKIGRILDGDVSGEERVALLAEIERIPGAQELLQEMSEDNARLTQAISASIPQASMERFEAAIDYEFDGQNSPRPLKHGGSWVRAGLQIAATLVLIAGTFAFTTYWMQSRMDDAVASLAAHMETERILLAQTVQDALETKMSGEPVHIGQEGNWSEILTPIKTYKSKSGHWCRQYLRETTFGGLALSIRGTACRDQNGTWTTVFAEPVSDKFSPRSSGI
jgi:surface antigen